VPQGPFGVAALKFATYRYADATRSAPANAGPLWMIFGSATKKTKLRRLKIVARATAQTQIDVIINKRTTANAPAAGVALTAAYDDSDGAPGSIVQAITAGVTAYGALQGAVDADQIILTPAGTSNLLNGDVVFDYSLQDLWSPAKAPTLNSATEYFEINVGGGSGTWTTVAGNVFDMSMVITEGG
jgi:hypothetical protein